jgi:cyclopropane fatty-acyl-phospholipid synthase-like methyltransferase
MDSYDVTRDGFNKLASAYQDKFMDLDLYNDSYDLFCSHLQLSSDVLDIGCGPGNITRYLFSKRPDLKIRGIDVAPEMVRLAQSNNPTTSFQVLDARDILKLTDKFDGIICGFCLPYLSQKDCAKLISDSYSLLKENGVLYLSAIEGNYGQSGYESSSNGEAKAYVYYHSSDNIKEVLKVNNFEVIQLLRKEYSKSQDELSTHIIFIARKNSIGQAR